MTTKPMIDRTTPRAEIEQELREHQALLASIPDRGFDSARRRAEIRDDIDVLLELLNETL